MRLFQWHRVGFMQPYLQKAALLGRKVNHLQSLSLIYYCSLYLILFDLRLQCGGSMHVQSHVFISKLKFPILTHVNLQLALLDVPAHDMQIYLNTSGNWKISAVSTVCTLSKRQSLQLQGIIHTCSWARSNNWASVGAFRHLWRKLKRLRTCLRA